MDPLGTLLGAEMLIDDERMEEATLYLSEYRRWRDRGGFEPAGGDARWAALSLRLAAMKHDKEDDHERATNP